VIEAVEHVKAAGRSKIKLYTRPWNKAMSKVCLDLGFVPEAYLRREYLDADLVQYSVFFE
jgi:RimJ/RimL family protein N-acetyltransferase